MQITNPNIPENQKLLDRLRTVIRVKHYSLRTEEAYAGWVRRYILFHRKRHPAEMGEPEVRQFLIYLAEDLKVSAATQNQALNALVFLYRSVLEAPLGELGSFARAKRSEHLPVVLTKAEVLAVLAHIQGIARLVGLLLYGSGLRLLECLTLRVKDVDFETMEIRVRRAKGGKDRVTMLPSTVRQALMAHLIEVRRLHEKDLLHGAGRTRLPDGLARKYPNADREWAWQFIFPAGSRYFDRTERMERRHHLHESVIQKAIRKAAQQAGITSP